VSAEAEWLAAERERRDQLDYRRSLYTNFKSDHPANDLTGEPCRCEQGNDRDWHGFSPGTPVRPQYDPCGSVPEPRKRSGRSR
jgi:hypothetical protein